jgi:hypothetical protein
MKIEAIDFTKRSNGFHYFREHKFEAVKVGSGVGVLVSFSMSQIDADFKTVLASNEVGLWPPSQDELDLIQCCLDQSDKETATLINKKKWGGRRPYKKR